MVKEHAPPGGGNEQLTNLMREAGVFEGMARSVEEVHRRLTGSSTEKPGQVSGRPGG
jgi:hypothetical protein